MSSDFIAGHGKSCDVPRGADIGSIRDVVPLADEHFKIETDKEVHAVLNVIESDDLFVNTPGAVLVEVLDANDGDKELFAFHITKKQARVLAAMLIEAASV